MILLLNKCMCINSVTFPLFFLPQIAQITQITQITQINVFCGFCGSFKYIENKNKNCYKDTNLTPRQ